MFGIFGKKEAKDPAEQVALCQSKGDWAGLSRAYYTLGKTAMEENRLEEAVLWLHRSDTIYSADDRVYGKVGESVTDDCSDRIGELEEAPLLYNEIPAAVEERAAALDDPQVRVWGLLSLARLVRLGERLSALPGCAVLGDLGWAVDQVLTGLRGTLPSQSDYQRLVAVSDGLYGLGDSAAFYGGGEIEVPGGAPFQVFDLNGMLTLLELNGYLDHHLQLLAALSQQADPVQAESGLIGCTLLPDYYVRTGCKLAEVPQIQAELDRIWSDYAFVRSGITWEEAAERVEAYKALDLLAV